MKLTVLKSGLLTTVQDLGAKGFPAPGRADGAVPWIKLPCALQTFWWEIRITLPCWSCPCRGLSFALSRIPLSPWLEQIFRQV